MSKVRLQHEHSEQPVEVELEQLSASSSGTYVARVGEARYEIEVVRTGAGIDFLRMQGHIIPFHSLRTEHGIEVWVHGRTYRFNSVDRLARRAVSSAGAVPQEEIKAPMPGTILKINVAAGDIFESHAALIVMESMKMEMALSVPHAGRVKELFCKVGELVPMGQVLARLEQEVPDAAAARQDR